MEPTYGLNPQEPPEFHALIVRQRDAGAAMFMVNRNLFRTREIGNRIGLMPEGSLGRMIDAADITGPDLERLFLKKTGPTMA